MVPTVARSPDNMSREVRCLDFSMKYKNGLTLATKNQTLYGPNKNVCGYGNLSDPDQAVHFIDGETEAQRNLAFLPNSRRTLVAEIGQALNRLDLSPVFLPRGFWRAGAGARLPLPLHFDLNRGSCCPYDQPDPERHRAVGQTWL